MPASSHDDLPLGESEQKYRRLVEGLTKDIADLKIATEVIRKKEAHLAHVSPIWRTFRDWQRWVPS